MDIILGFDPGGVGAFGWCVACDMGVLPLEIIASGVESDARSAVEACVQRIPSGQAPLAAGIDAPLVWSRSGGRTCDRRLRSVIGAAGAPNVAGTVQAINSLRGACLVQGVLAAVELRERFPDLVISEAHPKALRWLLGEAKAVSATPEHVRDAVLSAFSGWAALHRPSDWTDLYSLDPGAYRPIAGLLVYFMPIPPANNVLHPTGAW